MGCGDVERSAGRYDIAMADIRRLLFDEAASEGGQAAPSRKVVGQALRRLRHMAHLQSGPDPDDGSQ